MKYFPGPTLSIFITGVNDTGEVPKVVNIFISFLKKFEKAKTLQ